MMKSADPSPRCLRLRIPPQSLIHNDGKTLWFDKSFNFVVFPDGRAGMNAEHSYADALTVAHMWEWVLTGERKESFEEKKREHNKHVIGYTEALKNPVKITPPKRLSFEFGPSAKAAIKEVCHRKNHVEACMPAPFLQFGDKMMVHACVQDTTR